MPRFGEKRNRKKSLVVAFSFVGAVALFPLATLGALLLLIRTLRDAREQEISEPSTGGSLSVEPPLVTAGGPPVPVTLRYVVGPDGIEPGGSVRLCQGKVLRFKPDAWRLCLQWASGWGGLQRRNPAKNNFLSVTASREDVVLEVSLMERAAERTQLRWLKRKLIQKLGVNLPPIDPKNALLENMKVTVTVANGRLREGDVILFTLGDGAGLELPDNPVRTDFALEVDPGGSGEFLLKSAVAELEATGGEPASFEVVAPSTALPGGEISVLLRCLDGRGFLTPHFCGRVLISASGPLETPGSLLVVEGNEGVARMRSLVRGSGVARIEVCDVSGNLHGESNPVLCSDTGYTLLWGDLHTHSLVSDGTQEPSYLYHRARDLLGWDFTAVSEHDIWSLGEERPRTPPEIDLMRRSADQNYVPGEFVTFQAYEWTHHRLGHRSVIFGPAEEFEFFPHTDPRYSTPEKLFQALAGRDVLVIPHHTAWKTHAGEMRADFGPAGNDAQRLVEVYSKHGSSEAPGGSPPISHAALVEGLKGRLIRLIVGEESAGHRSGSYVRDALAAGHRFGLIAGSDEHLVGVGPRRAPQPIHDGGLAGIYAAERTRESAWAAMKRRAVCGTTGERILMELRVSGVLQGAELAADEPPRITGYVLGADTLELVELVKFDGGGYSVAWRGGGESECSIDFTDRSFNGDSFYYLRVVQENGHMGWAGPTWVDLKR